MRLIPVTLPAIEPVTLAEAKAHLRVDDTADDALITQMITTARQALDGRDGFLGRALITQAWKLSLDRFANPIEIPLPPLQSVTDVQYIPAGGTELQTVATGWLTAGVGGSEPARLYAGPNAISWPATAEHSEAISITFTAGYGATAAAVPGPIKQAMLMHIASMYEHRESVTLGAGFMTETPHGYHDLVSDYRLWGF